MKVSVAFWLLVALDLAVAGAHNSKTWAVLVAGSKGWFNYRFQANICHAYQLMIKNGVDASNIIVMMYDDIANNPQNDHPGQIFNKPEGPDVYNGVKIDYRGDEVNAENFKNVLLANKEALKGKGTERVLESGENDFVFINFVHFGERNALLFPNEKLDGGDFNGILQDMKKKNKFGKLVLYVEGQNSGSLFDNRLGENDNIIAVTAASPTNPDWSWYCNAFYSDCLGTLFGITWMERMDKTNFSETIFEQFDAIRFQTIDYLHPHIYGDYRIGFSRFGQM